MGERDERIDFLRGLALIVICLDHIYGNVIASFTPLALGYSDMAEVFVFLSGVVSAWSFESRLSRQGAIRTISDFWVRSFYLYSAYVVAGTLLILWMRATGTTAFIDFHQWGATVNPMRRLFRDIALLRQHVPHLTILPIYILEFLVLPLLLLSVRRLSQFGRQLTLLLVATVLYVAAKVNAFPIPDDIQRALYFHPASWLALFLTGAALGCSSRTTRLPLWRLARWILGMICAGGLIIFFALAHTQAVARYIDKPTLGPLRLVHFFLAAVLAMVLLPKRSKWYWKSVQACGRQSLWVYLAGAFVSVLLTAVLQNLEGVWWGQIVVNVEAVLACLFVGRVASRQHRSPPVEHGIPEPL